MRKHTESCNYLFFLGVPGVDIKCALRYNGTMNTRKKRCDRNHVIYMVTCPETNDFYVGLTVAQGRAFLNSVKVRFQKHVSSAKCNTKNWAFAEFLRSNPDAEYQYEVLDIVRGRKAAHELERALIAFFEPTLNTK